MQHPTTITDAAGFIRTGELTPSDLLEQCLARIDRYEERVHAWVYLDREWAREQAARLTAELKQNNYRGPLHGIPIGIKDIIDVFDMPTGCGSKLWANSYARRDATCVERLRQAGAIIMGKTVTTAYASFDPPVTRNPWNLERTPGGSSSGSAAAVACGMCLGALATQTGGSITRPASYCGVCSIKPTYGRVSVDGVLPLAPSMDHVGAMANCVRDLAILFQTIAGYDPDAPWSRRLPVPDCLRAIDQEINSVVPEARRGEPQHRMRFSVPTEFSPEQLHPDVAKFMRRVERDLTTLAHAGTAVEHITLPAEFGEVHHRHAQVMAVEAAGYHAERLKRHPDDYPPRIRGLVMDGLVISATEYAQADYIRRELQGQLMNSWSPHPLLTPATLTPAPPAETTGNPWCNSPWSFLGLPTVSIPLGWSGDGLPLSVQLVGGEYREDYLLARAAWVEHVFRLDKASETRPLPL
jgi:Asp-tRNA(Asn)/Glu-tRNA(Gln) amidotransferase A subunit family amidase